MPKSVRDKILEGRGMVTTRPAPRKHTRLKPVHLPHLARLKTPKMKYLELKYKEPMEKVLMSGSLSVVAKRLGNEVDTSTISKWIKKLKLRYGVDNLPTCQDCPHEQPICSLGVCVLLIELELWELVEIKKQEVLNGETEGGY